MEKGEMDSNYIYAIDFGTSNSLLAASVGGELRDPIALDTAAKDPTIMRSLMYFPSMDKVYYGTKALSEFNEQQGKGRLLRSIKRYLPVRSFIGTWIDDRPINLEDIIALFLAEMRRRANTHFDADVTSVVLGRPAKFSLDAGEDKFAEARLEIAARKAGFKHIEFMPEPIAAALDFRAKLKDTKIIMVADFGGGTSDFTVIRIHPGVYHPSDVLSVSGIPIAGDALDGRIMRRRVAKHFGADTQYRVPFGSNLLQMPTHLIERISSPAEISMLQKRDIREFLRSIERWLTDPKEAVPIQNLIRLIEEQLGFPLFEQIEKSKRDLSDVEVAKIQFEHGMEIDENISRTDFESYVAEPVQKILATVDEALALAGISPGEIDSVCCTGGTSQVPLIHEGLVQRFGKEKLWGHENFHSVVKGLSQRANELQRET
jgi:hypothetical chaperone protein